MRWTINLFLLILWGLLFSCATAKKSTNSKSNVLVRTKTRVIQNENAVSTKEPEKIKPASVEENHNLRLMKDNTIASNRNDVILFAKQFIGTPYVYASSNPEKGFDCSGFLFYIFQNFNIKSPRVSFDFDNVGIAVTEAESQPGDLILFTGEHSKKIGHVGMITKNENNRIWFIHSSSPQSGGVIISSLDGYYEDHFVRIRKVFD